MRSQDKKQDTKGKRDKPKIVEAPRSGGKARTAENKARRAQTRQRRFQRAAERRTKAGYTDPITGKARRGTNAERKDFSSISAKREAQTDRIIKKRRQRKVFSSLSAKAQRERREAGMAHKTPEGM